MHTLNLGILAHVDAGKTSLTERLLHATGVIDTLGSVDAGSTRTDPLALERRRGITIKSAVASFVIGDDLAVNLIDTPGHPDFIAEVERVLSVLDGAVLVVSAVEGVQAQTRVLLRTLRRLRIPTLIFVNKLDRGGADATRVLRDIAGRLTPAVVAMGSVQRAGARSAAVSPYGTGDPAFATRLADLLTRRNDALLAAWLRAGGALPQDRLRAELAAQTGRVLVHPVFFGSAVTGAGVADLIAGIAELLPAAAADVEGPLAGSVFKVERGPAGEKVAYVRMFSGQLRVRDRVPFGGGRPDEPVQEGKVTSVGVFEADGAVPGEAVRAGQIGLVRGLGGIRVGDTIGTGAGPHAQRHFAPPTLETVVVPRRAADRAALHTALTRLAEQDPLIDLRQDPIRRETFVSLYGEVQKEVIEATLAEEFGVRVGFRASTTIHIERPAGTGAAVEFIGVDPNPFLGTVGLRVEPAPVGSGVAFRLAVELGSMPAAFMTAIEETVRETLHQGLYGWRVVDCTVTLTHSGYWARQSHAHGTFDKSMSSTAGDFRGLTPLVLAAALQQAGTEVYEPVHRFRLEIPGDVLDAMLPVLARLHALPASTVAHGSGYLLEGDVPAARVHELQQQLPTLTRGEGVLECAFDHHRRVRGTPPARPRTDHDPLDRKQYLLHVVRRV
ncbi:elongation factor G [Streptomyces odontomachi]|uniref:elongation factor G n=1 Tax=Streptomyces odontomachi TaxID=2944940 RepID=UPI00210DCC3B|nr:TetM/TetW/TetO/TetS family tetracycline resistance ribosomal protection protein [Streptomyces sp. ODS25]